MTDHFDVLELFERLSSAEIDLYFQGDGSVSQELSTMLDGMVSNIIELLFIFGDVLFDENRIFRLGLGWNDR